MPSIESRVAWTVSAKDRDVSLGFGGRYGRGRNIGSTGTATVVQPINYRLPFTNVFNLTGEAYIGRALGIYNVAAGEDIGPVGMPGGHGVLSCGGWIQPQFNLNSSGSSMSAMGSTIPALVTSPSEGAIAIKTT
jgi:hypothetical protein